MKAYPPARGPASTNARLDAPARRQFQGAAPHEPLFVERWATATRSRAERDVEPSVKSVRWWISDRDASGPVGGTVQREDR